MTTRAISLISSTLGAIIFGVLNLSGYSNQTILYIASFILLSSVLPIIFIPKVISKNFVFINDVTEAKELNDNRDNKKSHKFLTIPIIIVFISLGFAPLIQNFVNLYFRSRYNLSDYNISFIVATVTLLTGIMVILNSKIKANNIKNIKLNFVFLGFSIFLLNIMLIIIGNIVFHVIGILLILGLFQIYYSITYDMVLSNTKNKIHGKISGFINMSSNLSETLGIYTGSILIIGLNFNLVFMISAISSFFVIMATLYVIKFRGEIYG